MLDHKACVAGHPKPLLYSKMKQNLIYIYLLYSTNTVVT